jgi:hypothetical protein
MFKYNKLDLIQGFEERTEKPEDNNKYPNGINKGPTRHVNSNKKNNRN